MAPPGGGGGGLSRQRTTHAVPLYVFMHCALSEQEQKGEVGLMLVCVFVSSLARVLTRVEIWCVSYVSSLASLNYRSRSSHRRFTQPSSGPLWTD